MGSRRTLTLYDSTNSNKSVPACKVRPRTGMVNYGYATIPDALMVLPSSTLRITKAPRLFHKTERNPNIVKFATPLYRLWPGSFARDTRPLNHIARRLN